MTDLTLKRYWKQLTRRTWQPAVVERIIERVKNGAETLHVDGTCKEVSHDPDLRKRH